MGLFSYRQVYRLLAVSTVVFMLYIYHNCSPYVCSPNFSTPNKLHGYGEGYTDSKYLGADDHPQAQNSARSRKALVVASLQGDDTAWLHQFFPDWTTNLYVMDDPDAFLTVAENKGRESMAYLTYIIDNYHNLPDYIVFMHALRYQWHNEDPMYDGVPVLQNLQLPFIDVAGYVNLRCTWNLGCPAELKPEKTITRLEALLEPHNDRANTEASYAHAFQELFPGETVPDAVGVHCGAQFAVSRDRILDRPQQDYRRYRDWLWETSLEDSISGRIMEYSWHMIFGKEAVECPHAGICFCLKFGLCDLDCEEDHCEKRYQLPRFASIPDGWPKYGPGEDGFPDHGWWE